MSQINCHLPIKLRLVGELNDAQLEQLGQTLVRTLQARLALAERTIAARANLIDLGSVRTVRDVYDPALTDDDGMAYRIPSYDAQGQRVSMPLQRQGHAGGRPWIIRKAINFHVYVGPFLALIESLSAVPLGTEVYADLEQEQRWVSLWLVEVNQSLLRSELMDALAERAIDLNSPHAGPVQFFAMYGNDQFRQQLIDLDLDHIIAHTMPTLGQQTALLEAGGDIRLGVGTRVLFSNLMLPKIVLKDRADLGSALLVTVRLRDLTFLVNPTAFDRFERRFGLAWAAYLHEFGDQPAILRIQPLTIRQGTESSALAALLEAELASPAGTVVYHRLDLLTSTILGQWPLAAGDIGNRLTDEATRRLDKAYTVGKLAPNWKIAYLSTGLTISPKSVEIARYRPGAAQQADRLIPLISDRLVTVAERWAFINFLKHNYSSLFPSSFEVLLDELAQREQGRWFGRLFAATAEANDYDLRLLVINLAKQTPYANDPRVLALVRHHNQINRQHSSGNVYKVADQTIILDKFFGDKTVAVNDILYDIYSTYVHEEKRYKPKPIYASMWAGLLLQESFALIGRIEKGDDLQGNASGYTETEFAEAVLKAVFSKIQITEDNFADYFDTVTVQLSVRFLGIKQRTDELGIETLSVLYQVVEREGSGSWKVIGEILEASAADFDFMIDRWVHEHVSAAIITIAHISLAIAAVGVAWEFGVIQFFTRIAGGAKVVIPSIILSTIFEVIINGFTFESFLFGAINGYLGALFFRGAGGAARAIFGRSITTLSFRQGLLRWIAAQIFKGVVGGGSTGAAFRFTHDVYLVATGRGTWSSPQAYAKSIGLGAAIGIGAEFAGPLVLEPVLGRLGGGAVDVAKLLRSNGISPARWQAWSVQALSRIRQNLNELLASAPTRATNIREGFSLLYEQVGEAYAGLGGAIRGRIQLSVFRQLLAFSGENLSGSSAKGLEKFLKSSASRLDEETVLGIVKQILAPGGRAKEFFALLGELEQSSVRRILDSFTAANSAQIQAQIEILLQSGPARESLATFLDLVWANRQHVIDEGDYTAIYQLYSRATEANPLTRSAQEYLDDIAGLRQGRPQGAVSNLQGKAMRGFHRFERAGADLSRIQERIYLNVKADRAPEVMKFVVRDIIDNPSQVPGVGMAKLTGPGAISGRADGIVIYTENQAAVENVLARIQRYQVANRDYFQSTTPPMTNRVSDGVSVGAEPIGAGGASFGSLRSRLVFDALDDAVAANETFKQFRERVLALFQRRGINPEAPQLNSPTRGTR